MKKRIFAVGDQLISQSGVIFAVILELPNEKKEAVRWYKCLIITGNSSSIMTIGENMLMKWNWLSSL